MESVPFLVEFQTENAVDWRVKKKKIMQGVRDKKLYQYAQNNPTNIQHTDPGEKYGEIT